MATTQSIGVAIMGDNKRKTVQGKGLQRSLSNKQKNVLVLMSKYSTLNESKFL